MVIICTYTSRISFLKSKIIAPKFSTTSQTTSRSSTTISTVRRIVASFARRGKKERIEHLVRSLWRAKYAGVNQRQAAASSTATSPGRRITALIRTFSLSATPFITLQTRRRGKRAIFKVAPLSRSRGERKALVALTSSLHQRGAASQAFPVRLARQLEALVPSATKRGAINAPTGSSAASSRRETRDELHRQAFRSIPTSWLR